MRLGDDEYLDRVEESAVAREACRVMVDLADHLARQDSSRADERARFFRSPRQRWLISRLRSEAGVLFEIGQLLARLPEGLGQAERRREIESLGAKARSLGASLVAVGRIP